MSRTVPARGALAAWVCLTVAIIAEVVGTSFMAHAARDGGWSGYLIMAGALALSYFFLAQSVRRIADLPVLTGAGTVTTVEQVRAVADAGGRLVVSPNTSVAVITETKERGLISAPGFFTATEAFTAFEAGADALKLFPASALGPKGLKALQAILPPLPVLAVGGVSAETLQDWAHADGWGVGSAVYRPGDSAEVVAEKARRLMEALP